MASDPTTYPLPKRRTGSRGFILFMALAFAAGILVTLALVRYYAGWTMTAPSRPGEATSTGSGMFQPPPEADSAPRSPDAAALDARVAMLSGRLAGLEAREAMIDQDSRFAAGNAGRAEALLVAFASRRAIDRGLGLGYLEGQLRQRFGASQPRAVNTIIDASRNPVTVEDLRLALESIAPVLTTGGIQDGWWASFHRALTGLVTLRKEGTPSPDPADRLARVRRLLDARQVEPALAEIDRMPGAGQAGAWRAAAQRYIDAHRALDLIETVALVGTGSPDPEAMMPHRAGQRPAVTTPPAPSAPTAPPTPTTATATTP
ncbi:hypothetical protein ACLB0R_08340 [Sphingomonas sp. GlSt437]|uniref:hypothetical protein n=1 Tax=Sphingomonas sp. GlSt437 TaxID=3389970 RepID=UPI003A8750FC